MELFENENPDRNSFLDIIEKILKHGWQVIVYKNTVTNSIITLKNSFYDYHGSMTKDCFSVTFILNHMYTTPSFLMNYIDK